MDDTNLMSASSLNEFGKLIKKRKTWSQIKTIVDFSRKLIFALNGDVPSNISFRESINKETGQAENRIYFLGGTQKRDITIKYIDIKPNVQYDKINGVPIFNNGMSFSNDKQQLTKEEQLLRERKRCAFNGITSYSLDDKSARLVFTERSDLFYFDDQTNEQNVNF